MPSPICVVYGCKSRDGISKHRFPKNDMSRFVLWIERSGNPKLLTMTLEKIYKSYLFCDLHFDTDCHSSGTKLLNRNAIPTLCLPVPIKFVLPDSFAHSSTNTIESISTCSALHSQAELSTSMIDTMPLTEVSQTDCSTIYGHVESVGPKVAINIVPITDLSNSDFIGLDGIKPLESTTKLRASGSSQKDNYNLVRRSRKGCLKDINFTWHKHMTPRKQFLYKAIVDLKKTLSVVTKRRLSTKQRLYRSEKIIKEHGLLFDNMNDTAKKFFQCQMKAQGVQPRGRRFSLDDKIFALSLYKGSAKAYRIMSGVFALPSKKTLMDLLRKIPLTPGINSQIIEHLKFVVSEFKNNLDKMCVLLFDEMSLASGLSYCESEDKIIGIEDLGRNVRRTKFANKALTFIIRGVKRKFSMVHKQFLSMNITTVL